MLAQHGLTDRTLYSVASSLTAFIYDLITVDFRVSWQKPFENNAVYRLQEKSKSEHVLISFLQNLFISSLTLQGNM